MRPSTGERVLDVACGNRVTSRLLAEAKARVTAFDFSEAMIDLARKRERQVSIDYRIIAATGRRELLALGVASLDAFPPDG